MEDVKGTKHTQFLVFLAFQLNHPVTHTHKHIFILPQPLVAIDTDNFAGLRTVPVVRLKMSC